MSITKALSRGVDPTLRRRGEDYFRQGRVKLLRSDPLGLDASVRGSRRYAVSLAVEENTLLCECDCPSFQSEVAPCKHVWAALLAAERQGLLEGGFTSLEPIDPGLDDGYLEEDEEASFDEEVTNPERAPARRPGRPAVWKESIELLRAARLRAPGLERFGSGQHEIVYLVDLATVYERERLTLQLLTRDRRRDGSWGKLRPLRITFEQVSRLPDPGDRRVLSLLQGASSPFMYGYRMGYELVERALEVPPATSDLFLREVCATGRCLVRRSASEEAAPLAHEGGGPWRFRVEMREDERRRGHVVTGHLVRGAETMPLAEPDLFLAAGIFFHRDRAFSFDHGGIFPLLVVLRRLGRIEVPRAQGAVFVSEILASGPDLLAALPEELRFQEVRVAPKPAVRILRSRTPWRQDQLSALVRFDYDGRLVEAGTEPAVLIDGEARRLIVRDLDAEGAAIGFLQSLGFRPNGFSSSDDRFSMELAPRRLPAVVPELVRAGWRAEAEGKLYRTASAFRIEVRSGIDWFELHGAATYDGVEVPLPALLAALKKGESVVALGDGSIGLLPEEWLRRYAPVAGLGEGKGDHVRFGRAQAGFLDALLAAEPEATCDDLFEHVRMKLREFDGVRPAAAPSGFRGSLRPYQKEGLGWLLFLREFGFGGCLADDMGLGKTIQALALLQARREQDKPGGGKPSLVVAPRSVVFNWLEEAGRFTPRLRVIDHTGLQRARSADALKHCDIVLTTYGTLRRDITLFKEVVFDIIVLDESQAIKNSGTQAAKAARLLRADQRIALSGTPIENHLGELWSLFEFLNPGMLGSSSAFQLGARAAKEPEGAARALLARALRPFILRRTKRHVAPELPDKTEQTLTCELEGAQRRRYDELREHYRMSLLSRLRTDGLAKSKIMILEALLRLRQAACHPALLDRKLAGEGSAKLDVLFAQLDEVLDEGHKALVFSQFTSLLALVKEQLDRRGIAYTYLDGSMGARPRREAVRRFQEDPRCPLFLLSLKAGGFGLNLTAAEYVYLLDPWWNPAVEAQAIDRTHRIGQTRPVFAYRIVAADTIEEKILALQASKRELADSILAADSSLMRDLTREDLELLLS